MNITTSLIRVAILIAVSSVALVGLFAVPADDCSMSFFILSMVITKGIAYYGFKVANYLYESWKDKDPIIGRYDRECKKGLNTPNPMYIGDAEDDE